MKYKMIVSDLDETLLNSDRKLTQHKVRNKRYTQKGGKFIIATGENDSVSIAVLL